MLLIWMMCLPSSYRPKVGKPHITLKVFLCKSHHPLKCKACSKFSPKYMKPRWIEAENDGSGNSPKNPRGTSKLTLQSNDSCRGKRSTFLYADLSIYLPIWAFWKAKIKESRTSDLWKRGSYKKGIISFFCSVCVSENLSFFSPSTHLFFLLTRVKRR